MTKARTEITLRQIADHAREAYSLVQGERGFGLNMKAGGRMSGVRGKMGRVQL